MAVACLVPSVGGTVRGARGKQTRQTSERANSWERISARRSSALRHRSTSRWGRVPCVHSSEGAWLLETGRGRLMNRGGRCGARRRVSNVEGRLLSPLRRTTMVEEMGECELGMPNRARLQQCTTAHISHSKTTRIKQSRWRAMRSLLRFSSFAKCFIFKRRCTSIRTTIRSLRGKEVIYLSNMLSPSAAAVQVNNSGSEGFSL